MVVGIGQFLTGLKRCCCVLSGCELNPPEATMRIKRVKRLFAAIVLGLPSLGLSQAAPPDLIIAKGCALEIPREHRNAARVCVFG
jgi:hypothetical protein